MKRYRQPTTGSQRRCIPIRDLFGSCASCTPFHTLSSSDSLVSFGTNQTVLLANQNLMYEKTKECKKERRKSDEKNSVRTLQKIHTVRSVFWADNNLSLLDIILFYLIINYNYLKPTNRTLLTLFRTRVVALIVWDNSTTFWREKII